MIKNIIYLKYLLQNFLGCMKTEVVTERVNYV